MRRALPLPRLFPASLLLLALVLCGAGSAEARPQNLEQLADITRYLVDVPMPGTITALYRPRYDSIGEADLKMTRNEPAFVVMLPGGPRIYPQRYMVWHQVVNELIDDHAYAITYCPITGTLMAYDASMQGLNLIFDVESHSGPCSVAECPPYPCSGPPGARRAASFRRRGCSPSRAAAGPTGATPMAAT